jgi:hypothetical protein
MRILLIAAIGYSSNDVRVRSKFQIYGLQESLNAKPYQLNAAAPLRRWFFQTNCGLVRSFVSSSTLPKVFWCCCRQIDEATAQVESFVK